VLAIVSVLLCLGALPLASCGPSPAPTVAAVAPTDTPVPRATATPTLAPTSISTAAPIVTSTATPERTQLPPPTSPDFPAGVFFHKHPDGTFCVYRFNEEGSFAFWWMVSSLDVSHTWPLSSGTYAVDGNLYTEMSDSVADCPPATYAWTYDGQTLAFQLVGEDKCADRQQTVEKPWTKSD
jgi:hypothetical protein